MCGIVRNPTRKNRPSVPLENFTSLSHDTVMTILGVCEDTHIPEEATRAVLLFAEQASKERNFVLLSIPFAIYQNGKRYITKETMLIEQAMMHLAMAGATRHYINEALELCGIKFELGHCCDIQMHELAYSAEALMRSHDGNVYRADRLRELREDDEVTLTLNEFLNLMKQDRCREIASSIFLEDISAEMA